MNEDDANATILDDGKGGVLRWRHNIGISFEEEVECKTKYVWDTAGNVKGEGRGSMNWWIECLPEIH